MKFGVWPRTKRLAYGERWLGWFLQAVLAESSWLRMSSFSEVARELRRRIKMRFDAEGIEIPFPRRVIHHVKAPPEPAGGGTTGTPDVP